MTLSPSSVDTSNVFDRLYDQQDLNLNLDYRGDEKVSMFSHLQSSPTYLFSQHYPPTPTSYGVATSSQARANSYVSPSTSSFSSNNTMDSMDEKYIHQLPALRTQTYGPPHQQTLPPLSTKIPLTPLTPSSNGSYSSASSYRSSADVCNTSYTAYTTPRGQHLPEYGRLNTYSNPGRYDESSATLPSTSYMPSQQYQQQPQQQSYSHYQGQQHPLSTLAHAAATTQVFSPTSAISSHFQHPSSSTSYAHNHPISASNSDSQPHSASSNIHNNNKLQETLTAYNTMHNHNNHTQLGYMPTGANVSYARSTATHTQPNHSQHMPHKHNSQSQVYGPCFSSSSSSAAGDIPGNRDELYGWQYAPAQPLVGPESGVVGSASVAVMREPRGVRDVVLPSSSSSSSSSLMGRGRLLAAKMGRDARECY